MKSARIPTVTKCVVFLLLLVFSSTKLLASDVKKSPAPILVVGDSLSAAYNLAEHQGWVALLETRLQTDSEHHYPVINASVGGATTAAALQRLPALLKLHHPSLVILEMGANDGLQGKPVDYISSNLEQLIQLCLNANARVVLVGIQLPPNYGKRYTQPFFAQYAHLAKKYQLALVPFLLEGVAGNPGLMQEDRLHPTAEAQPLLLETVWGILEQEL